MNVLLWFKRDLRVSDHPALSHGLQAGRGRVLPVYVAEPGYWALPDTSARQWAFTAECLSDLRDALGNLGQPLIVRIGRAEEVLAALVRAHRIDLVVSHEETGNLWTYGRDRRVAARLREIGVAWQELPQSGVERRSAGRDGWAARRDRFIGAAVVPPPVALAPWAGVEPGLIPTAAALRLAPDPCTARQAGGRAQGLRLLETFLTLRGRDYRAAMASPIGGERACSRLSPYLAMGALSGREVAWAARARRPDAGTGWGASLRSFESRLAWRDHFMQKLEDQPSIETCCLHPACEGLRPCTPDAVRLAAWTRGETGLPFVDACMRYLHATGWLNFRMRAMLMAVASYHLWLDWRATGPHLARMFTDYEPGIHWPQVQMQSGVTGMNRVRIYNPVKQGQDQDPTGRFTRRWVPELGDVPDRFLQTPWKWDGAVEVLGRRYPEPIVDVTTAARAARDAVWGQRSAEGFRADAARIVQRHASRKPASRARRQALAQGQLRFDL